MSDTLEPITASDDFMAICHEGKMDFSALKDKLFIVAVATGDPNSVKCLASTIHGPYTCIEMVEKVGKMWEEQLHHARVIILSQDDKKSAEYLDAGTIAYIEHDWKNIAFEIGMDILLGDKELVPGVRTQTEVVPLKEQK